jgi:isoquinoline 1-oxidoreductase beta subunit
MNNLEADPDKETKDHPKMNWRLSRRGFLIGLSVTGTALGLGVPIGLPIARKKIAEFVAKSFAFSQGDLKPLLWIEILPDDRIRLLVPKTEMGQGTHTGLAQIAADELEVSINRLEVIHASTTQAEEKYRGTFGSQSILGLYTPLRRAAATVREMLRMQAAVHLKQPAEKLIARAGGFEITGNSKNRVTYGALVKQTTDWQMPDKDVALKQEKDFKLIGKPLPRIDLPVKVTGKAVFGSDVRAQGMLYGAVIHKPTFDAKIVDIKPGKANDMPGVVKVVIEKNFGGVVAESRLEAAAARDALEVAWDKGHLWQQMELEQIVSVGGPGGVVIQEKGDAESVPKTGPVLTSEYRTGLGCHAPLETQAAMADMGPKGGRVWTSTQTESMVAGDVSKALGMEQGLIEIIPTYVGGGFGRKSDTPQVPHVGVEAAILSKAVRKPVHVSWDRDEEMKNGFFRPMTHQRITGRLDDQGRIQAVEHRQASAEVLLASLPNLAGYIIGFDPGATNGSWILYAIPYRKLAVWRRKIPVPTGPWRGMGLFPNTFALESFMDEMAHAAGIDPLQFRLNHLPEDFFGKRMAAVLKAAAKAAGWKTPLPEGRAQGIACCEWTDTVMAEVAEISCDTKTGIIQVHKVYAAMDCGLAVNPNQVTAQIEGGIVMGTGASILEEIIVKDGSVIAENFDQYPLLKMDEAPEVETILLEAGDGKPRGVGEPPLGPIGAAIGNAFFALTGVRLRQLPMTPERVLAKVERLMG